MEAVSNQTEPKSNAETASRAWLIVAAAALRTAFGVFMAIDAWLKWQPGFAAHYVGYLQNAANAQPRWLEAWFHMWLRLVTMHAGFFITTTRLIETAIAIGLLLGLARRITYFAGALFSLLIWSTAEGFGGPYTSGATNVGPALVYALVFVAAALFEHLLGRNPYSLDYYIGRRFPKWASLVEWAPKRLAQPPPALGWDQQLGVIGGIIVGLGWASFCMATLEASLVLARRRASRAVIEERPAPSEAPMT